MVAFCDLNLDPMTFIYEFDLYSLKMYLHSKMNILARKSASMESVLLHFFAKTC